MIYDYKNGIYAFDARYERDGVVSLYVVLDGERAAIVDTANNRALPYAVDALNELGVPRENVDYILLTHVHLDHAGGAGLFMREFENAKLVVHPRGARHMIDPAKLFASVQEVYGAEEAARMYGELLPVPESRVLTPSDGEVIRLGGRTIVCLDTPGHAKHHIAYLDRAADAVFAGDAFGVTHAGLYVNEGQGIIPTTSPVQFDAEAMRRSIDRIVALAPAAVYLTHFGAIRDVARTAADLHRLIDDHERAVERAGGDYERTLAALRALFEQELDRQAWPISKEEMRDTFKTTIELNAQGLCVWHGNRRAKDGS